MTIKKHYIYNKVGLGLCALALGTTGCSDFLEVEPLDQIVLENFWNEKSDVDNMIAGCYSAMQSQAFMDRVIVWGEARSENLDAGDQSSNDVDVQNVMKENITPTNGFAKWNEFYNVINSCNTILRYAPEVAQKDPNYTQYELRATIAEASALRDLCYFYLIRTFRDVPYTTTPYTDDTQELVQPATPFNVVLDSLINDLESVVDMATYMYPETKENYQTGRITQDAIHAMLCDMYLWKQDWAKAIEHADTVIGSKLRDYNEKAERVGGVQSGLVDPLINGYPLISDAYIKDVEYGLAYSTIFGHDGNSSESIFELNYVDDNTRLSNLGVSVRFGSIDGGNGSFKPSDLVTTDHTGSRVIFKSKNDMRTYENIYRLSSANVAVAKYASPMVYVDVTQTEYSTSLQSSRWSKNQCHANWIFYRLTDVMLMKAEALARLMTAGAEGGMTPDSQEKLDEAFNLVEAVNHRSYAKATSDPVLSKPSNQNAMIELVFDERQRELMFEGKRWFDLVRRSMIDGKTDYLVEKATRKHSAANLAVATSKLSIMNAIFWPYYEEELKVNPLLKQNPAFATSENGGFEIAD